jgi:glycosyl transferase, family 25
MPAAPHDQIPVFVINLERATERRKRMESQLAALGIGFSFFPAVDGARLGADALAELQVGPCLRDYGRRLLPPEIGCVASYMQVLKNIAAGSDPYVCVLEDDARLAETLSAVLSRAWLDTLPSFDFLRLVFQADRVRKSPYFLVAKIGTHDIVAPVHIGYLTTGQIVSRDGAKRALSKLIPVNASIDNMLYRDPVTPLRVIETRPGVVFHEYLETQMEGRDQALRRVRKDRSISDVAKRILFKETTKVKNWRNFIRHWGVKSTVGLRWSNRWAAHLD